MYAGDGRCDDARRDEKQDHSADHERSLLIFALHFARVESGQCARIRQRQLLRGRHRPRKRRGALCV